MTYATLFLFMTIITGPAAGAMVAAAEQASGGRVATTALLGLVVASVLGVSANRIAWSALTSQKMKEGVSMLVYMAVPLLSWLLVAAAATGIGFWLS